MMPSDDGKETFSQFEKPLAALARDGVDFALVGGLAVILNGYPRLTLDADILIHPAPANVARMLAVLQNWGEGWARELSATDFAALEEGSIRVSEDFDLDIFVRLRCRTLDDFRPGLRRFSAGGVEIPYVAPAALIHCKTGSWRDKDRLDVLAMQEILAREAAAGGPA